jgi:hypothetical protein
LPYTGSMGRLDLPPRRSLEEQVRLLLETARDRSGAPIGEMVKALGALQARGAGTRRSWYDWQERPETVSALTLLAVIRVIGRAGIMELLFDGLTPPSEQNASVDEMAARVNHLEDQLAGFMEVTTRLQETVRIQGDLLDRIADALPEILRGQARQSVRSATNPSEEGQSKGRPPGVARGVRPD